MQFKNPEILYCLFFLIIPILVHLFQLQKFKKTAFTNVAFLQKISQQTRKSSALKKWLILATRMFLFFGLILAFSQPYFPSQNTINNNQENWIYLDNSMSLNSKGKRGDLLQNFSKEILENLQEDANISLITNDNIYSNVRKKDLQSVLKNIQYSTKKRDIKDLLLEIRLKNKNKTNKLSELILISDFQNNNKNNFTDVNTRFSLISDQPEAQNNISIDSLFVQKQSSNSVTLQITITNHGEKQNNLPFSIFVNQKLNNKQSVSIQKKESKNIEFTIQKSPYILGEIQLDFQDAFLFDNRFFFTLDFRSKIKVLSIGKNEDYLRRIFRPSEFDFASTSLSAINFNRIPNQQFIILNELETFSSALLTSIQKFIDNGGSILIIPNRNLDIRSYNSFFRFYQLGSIQNRVNDSLQVTKIKFDHPVFADVFSKRVQNFEYPTIYQRFQTTFQGNPVLSFANQSPFLEELNTSNGNIYWIAGAINNKNSNFTRSPLIVPTLYNLAYQSASVIKPFYHAGGEFEVEIPEKLEKDEILKVSRGNEEFIPLQETQFNKVRLKLYNNIDKSGFYAITRNKDTLQQVAVNYSPDESTHNYMDANSVANEFKNVELIESIDQLFFKLGEKNKVRSYWKLFLAISIVSLCFEILILKFFKT